MLVDMILDTLSLSDKVHAFKVGSLVLNQIFTICTLNKLNMVKKFLLLIFGVFYKAILVWLSLYASLINK